MDPKKRILLLILIMSSIVLIVEAVTIGVLYNTAITENRSRLEETAKSQARLIEAVGRFDKIYSNDYPSGARQATLDQIKSAHEQYRGFGETGEFTLSKKKKDQIVFLLSHRHYDLNNPRPVAWDSELAEPMRLALSGESGTIIGMDYRGKTVLAAYEPVAVMDLGIVAKIDLWEIQRPFIRAALISGLFAIVIILLGVSLFFKITNPLLTSLTDTVARLKKALEEVKTLRGIIPICSFCKKIRDDKGYWSQVEVYVKERSHASFSHGVCPECMEEHYGDYAPKKR